MKRFIYNLILFTILWLGCCIALGSVLCLTRSQTLRLPHDEHIIFLGNSHIQCAINDTILKNSYNIARGNEYTEQIYYKLKLLKRYNPQIDTVIIGFDNVIMSQNLGNEILGMFSPYYYDCVSITDVLQLTEHGAFKYVVSHLYNPFHIVKIEELVPSFYKDDIDLTDLKHFGSYEYLYRDKLQYNIDSQRNKQPRKMPVDTLSAYFLNKAIEFCDENDMKVILLFTPQHHKTKIDTVAYSEYYHKNLSHITFYDYRQFNVPDSCFGDINHLNYKGSMLFSEFFEKEVLHKNNYKNNSLN